MQSQRGGFFTIAAWQRADDLVVKVYEVTDLKKGYFPKHQLYGLIQQFQKAAVSVAANIAEGSGRKTLNEYIHFLYIAQGSLTEVEYYIHLAHRMRYLPAAVATELQRLQRMTAGALKGFITFKENQRQHNQR
jgi:four helix bundle protein